MPRQRRRVVRPSDAVGYDRSFDTPDSAQHFADADRQVILDDVADGGESDAGDVASGHAGGHSREYFEEQKPPHYGE